MQKQPLGQFLNTQGWYGRGTNLETDPYIKR